MTTAWLYRVRSLSDDQGTIGVLSIPDKSFSCYTNELPWKDNQRNISCVPRGEYLVKIRQSPKYGTIFHLTDVDGRSYILIHAGNYAGDIVKGYRSDTQGCLLVGHKVGVLAGQRVVLNSRTTLLRFMNTMNNEPFNLIIQ